MTKCKNCEYEWQTKSTHIFVTCPSCYKKVKIRDVVGVTPTTEVNLPDKVKKEIEK